MEITIVGTGNMARGIGTRAVAGGHDVTLLGTEQAHAEALAGELDGSAVKAGTVGDPISGDVVVLAVWYPISREVVERYGDQLDGKVVVDITNPLDTDAFEPIVPEVGSGAQEVAGAAPNAKVARPSTRRSPERSPAEARSPGSRSTSSSPRTTRRRSAPSPSSSKTPGCGRSTRGRCAAPASSRRSATCTWASRSRSGPASRAPSRLCRRG